MKVKTLAITTGFMAALAVGLYLGSGAQAGTCTIGGDTGPGVAVMLAAQDQAQPAAPKPAASEGCVQKPAPAAQPAPADKDQKDKAAAQPTGAAPIVPIIAPDEGC